MSAPDPTLDQKLLAIADPTRREILIRLANGSATVTELCAPFDISQPAISKHLKVLEAAGLIARRREGKTRPCVALPGGLDVVLDTLGLLRRTMEANYERLDALWESMSVEEKMRASDSRPPKNSADGSKPAASPKGNRPSRKKR